MLALARGPVIDRGVVASRKNRASAVIVRNDVADGSGSGLVAQGTSTGNTIRLNEIHGLAGNGIRLLAGATGNTLIGNDATGNDGTDCMDDPEASTWTDNLGDDASPAGICVAPV